jgi:hypothetical protein
VIILGTNDAKDAVDGGPPNWVCGDDLSNITVQSCRFSQDYLSFIDLVRTLGPDANTPPKIYVAAPPPLMAHGSIGANQTVINTVYPTLVPLIAQAANVSTVPISAYAGMGGVPTWERDFPKQCTLDSPWAACPWYCDAQSCDQCHVSPWRLPRTPAPPRLPALTRTHYHPPCWLCERSPTTMATTTWPR